MRRFALRAASLLILAPLAACVTDGGEDFGDAGTVNIPLEGLCVDGCNLLEQCGQCDSDPVGECYDRVQCIEVCDTVGSHDRFACLFDPDAGGGAACGAGFQGCLDGSAVDGCHQACGNLEACNIGLLNENGGLQSVTACVERCHANQDEGPAFQCIVDLQACDEVAVGECFGGSPNLGDDDCARGCLALDTCELCLPDDAGECRSPQECVAECRGAAAAIDAARARCLANLDACGEDAVNACLTPSIGDDDCAKGCVALDACDLCLNNENGECITPEACAEACRAGEGINTAQALCLENLDGCDEALVNACFEVEPPPAPDCAVFCQRSVECAALPAEEQAAALEACNTECAAADNAALRTCFVNAADCAAAAECAAE